METLNQKLVEIRKTLGCVEKDTKGHNYSYVSGSQVLAKIQNKMNELGVLLVPSIVPRTSEYERFEYDKNNKHMIDYIVKADMCMRWINAEDKEDILEVPFALYGHQDDVSKAYGSGLTYSERYFLLKFFNVPTDADDPDVKGNTINNGKSISEKQINRMYAIARDKNIKSEDVNKIILNELHKKPEEMTHIEYDNIVARLQAK